MSISEVSVDDLDGLLADSIRLYDVREPDEYEAGHVPGAVLVPLQTVPDNVDLFTGGGPVYVICQSGGRSMRACEFLDGHGIDTVNVAGGTGEWIRSGRPTATGDTPS
jgi:rhodanese-related sulfurtransferase